MTTRIITEAEAWAYPELGFTEPEVVPDAGYWRVFKPDGLPTHPGTISKSFHAHERARVLATLQGVPDVYVTQNYFTQKRCTKNYPRCIPGAWVDLDIYRIRGLTERSRPDLIRQLLAHCDDRAVPRPSYTIASGRGLYLKWSFTHPAEAAETPRCEALNKALAQIFKNFGGDTGAFDVARILRPVGSVNSKSGRVVHVAHREDTADGRPIRHDRTGLQAAVDAVVPRKRPSGTKRHGTQVARAARTPSCGPSLAVVSSQAAPAAAGGDWHHWNERVLADITRLADLRWPNGPIQEGWRDLFAFHAAVQIAHIENADQVMPVLRAWAAPRLPATFVAHELEAYMQSVCDRARQKQDGETVEFQRQIDGPVEQVSPIYTYTRATLVDRLAITPAESQHLDVLIDDDERRRRDRERKRKERRARGGRTQDERAVERAAEADQVAIRIELLRARGRSWPDIAAEFEISKDAARKRLKRLRQRRAERGDASAAGMAA